MFMMQLAFRKTGTVTPDKLFHMFTKEEVEDVIKDI
jgi:hypothetical protein